MANKQAVVRAPAQVVRDRGKVRGKVRGKGKARDKDKVRVKVRVRAKVRVVLATAVAAPTRAMRAVGKAAMAMSNQVAAAVIRAKD